jgi:hypothetical protein
MALEALAKIDDPALRRMSAVSAIRVLAGETNTDIFQFFEDTVGRDHLGERNQQFNLYALIEPDPAAAANWAAGLPADAEYRNDILSRVLEQWKDRAPKAAREWMEKQESAASGAEGSALNSLGSLWRARELLDAGKPQEAISALSNITEGGQALGNIAWELVRQDPAAAAQWALDLPDGKAREAVAGTVAANWTQRDPAAAAKWVEQLPAGPSRNAALLPMITNVVEQDPESASRWVSLYTDPEKRAISIRQVYSNWSARAPAAAREWVRTFPGIDEQWKTKFLRQNP